MIQCLMLFQEEFQVILLRKLESDHWFLVLKAGELSLMNLRKLGSLTEGFMDCLSGYFVRPLGQSHRNIFEGFDIKHFLNYF